MGGCYFFLYDFIIINNIIELNKSVMVSDTIICIDFKYIPYKIQNTKPVQYIIYIVKESPDTFLVMIDFIAWGKNATVVQVQQIMPIISPTILFIVGLPLFDFIRLRNYQSILGYKR